MSINDLLVTGADPLAFLDYLATSRIDLKIHPEVVAGIADGCIQSGCALIGGETAELPDFYGKDEYDLAGFAVGVVERSRILHPGTGQTWRPVDRASVHWNSFQWLFSGTKSVSGSRPLSSSQTSPGFTVPLGDPPACTDTDISSGIRNPEIDAGIEISCTYYRKRNSGKPAASHSGEIWVFQSLRVVWPILPVFSAIQTIGNVSDAEMFRTFNMGLGMILVVDPAQTDMIRDALSRQGFVAIQSGESNPNPDSDGSSLIIPAADPGITNQPELKSPPLPRVAILGSGQGQ